nr:M23/M56 family metallopeptidase [uncultured Carboxylicivirga sp.]
MIYIGYYLLKTSIVSGIFFLIYQALLRKESFFQMNRFYLLVSLLFSYLFPFVKLNIYTGTNSQLPIISNIQNSINQFSFSEEILLNEVHLTQPVNLVNNVGSVLLIGVSAVLLFRFFKHLFQIIKTIRVNDKIKQIKYTLVLLKQHNTFSFFRYIFISQNHLESTNGDVILNHERSHIKNKHTFDRLFIELMTILFWMNPFIYLYRKALEEVHEFQADNDAISTNESIRNYFRLVLQHSAGEAYTPLMSPFSYQLIKKRITMSNYKSKPIKKLALIIPVLIAAFIILTSATIKSSAIDNDSTESFSTAISEPKAKKQTFVLPFKTTDNYKITSDYGMRIHPITKEKRMHKGTDFKVKLNTPVVAIADGTIRKVELNYQEGKGYGKYIIVDHADGYSSLYAQLNDYKVKKGDKVKRGDVIGLSGSSGMSTGPHLHFEIKKDGENIDPMKVIKE